MAGTIIERRDHVLITLWEPLSFSASTFFIRWPSTNGPFFRLRGIGQTPQRFLPVRRRRMIWASLALPLRRVRPSGWPQGDTGWRPPEVLPSPPPWGWSTGFIETPRVWGLTPFQRLRPALPILISSCSELPTSPTVARQSIGTRRISVLGRRRVAKSPSLATSCTLDPALRAILPPPPGLISTLCTVVPTGM